MKVKCIKNHGSQLSKKTAVKTHQEHTEFQLNIGDSYTVYGIAIIEGMIEYLTYDKWGNVPFWHPAELFELIDHRLPPDWYFGIFSEEDKKTKLSDELMETITIEAIWGYKELALNPDHDLMLTERYPEAMEIFRKRQKEIDDFHNDQ